MANVTDNISSGINAVLRVADSFRILSTKLAQVLADILLDKKDSQLAVRLREEENRVNFFPISKKSH